MKSLFTIKALGAIALGVALAGCSANPVNNAVANMLDMGGGLPSVMTTKVIYGWIATDEATVRSQGRQDRAISYNQGVRYDYPQEVYRLARVDMSNHATSIMKWATAVVVPDSFPLLKLSLIHI